MGGPLDTSMETAVMFMSFIPTLLILLYLCREHHLNVSQENIFRRESRYILESMLLYALVNYLGSTRSRGN